MPGSKAPQFEAELAKEWHEVIAAGNEEEVRGDPQKFKLWVAAATMRYNQANPENKVDLGRGRLRFEKGLEEGYVQKQVEKHGRQTKARGSVRKVAEGDARAEQAAREEFFRGKSASGRRGYGGLAGAAREQLIDDVLAKAELDGEVPPKGVEAYESWMKVRMNRTHSKSRRKLAYSKRVAAWRAKKATAVKAGEIFNEPKPTRKNTRQAPIQVEEEPVEEKTVESEVPSDESGQGGYFGAKVRGHARGVKETFAKPAKKTRATVHDVIALGDKSTRADAKDRLSRRRKSAGAAAADSSKVAWQRTKAQIKDLWTQPTGDVKFTWKNFRSKQGKGITLLGFMILAIPAIYPALLLSILVVALAGAAAMGVGGDLNGAGVYGMHTVYGVLAALHNLLAFYGNGLIGLVYGGFVLLAAGAITIMGAVWNLLFGPIFSAVNGLLELFGQSPIQVIEFSAKNLTIQDGFGINYLVPATLSECGGGLFSTWDCGPYLKLESNDFSKSISLIDDKNYSFGSAAKAWFNSNGVVVEVKNGWNNLWGLIP